MGTTTRENYRDFAIITAYTRHIFQWKHLHNAINLCRNIKNITFIFRKTVIEMHLSKVAVKIPALFCFYKVLLLVFLRCVV